jgi:N-acetyl-S-(2-succino)cysteine monooxygenase
MNAHGEVEIINVVRGLWDCWSDKAVIADLKSGKFFDEREVKPLSHEGPRFSGIKPD